MTTSARRFWDEQARWNALVAICDSAEIRDPGRAEASFLEEGENTARTLQSFVHPQARVVDLGCGIGRVIRPLAPHVREIVGVDVSEEMIARARDYLRGIPNQRVVLTNGRSLPGIDDGSVDFLYSLLCFIHVDRRSAFRYFGEIERVLAPDGRALLQFHNILSPQGLAKFEGVVDSEYPLEFYTEEELTTKLRRCGLDVLECARSEEYFFVQAVKGQAGAWSSRWRKGLRLRVEHAAGWFTGGRRPRAESSELRARIDLVDGAWRGFDLRFRLCPQGAPHLGVRAGTSFSLQGPGQHELCLKIDAEHRLRVELDGRTLDALGSGSVPGAGAVELQAALVPSGLTLEETLLERFPESCLSCYLELAP